MTVLIAGTFAKINDGHKKLIDAALSLDTDIEISLASDAYVNKYKKYSVPFNIRRAEILKYLSETYRDSEWGITISSFDSPFDGVDRTKIKTIVCSQETLINVLAFNKLRSARGLAEVNIYCIPLTLNDFGKKLSSTELIENE